MTEENQRFSSDASAGAESSGAVLRLMRHVHEIKELRRKGWVVSGIPSPESVADHSYGISVLATVFAMRLDLDVGKTVITALLHDLCESIVGDITPHDGVDEDEKSDREDRAMAKVLHDLDQGGFLLELWRDFQYGRSPEGLLVGELDRLEMAFQADRYEATTGIKLAEFFDYANERISIPELRGAIELLVSARSKRWN